METVRAESLIFLPHLRKAEEGIASKIRTMAVAEPAYPPINFERAVTWCEARTGKRLAPSQREALRTVLASRVVIITGERLSESHRSKSATHPSHKSATPCSGF
jgi:exodeoxyribonuclease V alpha subunit